MNFHIQTRFFIENVKLLNFLRQRSFLQIWTKQLVNVERRKTPLGAEFLLVSKQMLYAKVL